MKDVQPTPDWLMQFNKNFDGVAGQLIADRRSTASPTSSPTSASRPTAEAASSRCCSRRAARAPMARWAAGTTPPAFYGDPSPALQEALAKAFKG